MSVLLPIPLLPVDGSNAFDLILISDISQSQSQTFYTKPTQQSLFGEKGPIKMADVQSTLACYVNIR